MLMYSEQRYSHENDKTESSVTLSLELFFLVAHTVMPNWDADQNDQAAIKCIGRWLFL